MKKTKDQIERRVVVVGAGGVGSTYCYALAQSGLAEEIIVIDKNEDLAKGQVLDLVHGKQDLTEPSTYCFFFFRCLFWFFHIHYFV